MFEPSYSPRLPARPRPICMIGAGSIVRDAHLPAYAMAGFPVHAIANRSREQAEVLAAKFGIPHVVAEVDELVALAPEGAVFDLTLPANLFAGVLRRLPEG